MKTRIVVKEQNNGVTIYEPQWQGLIFWHSFLKDQIYDFAPQVFQTTDLNEAKSVIDNHLRYQEAQLQKKQDQTIKKTSIIKYP